MAPEYSIEGRFPLEKRELISGLRRKTNTTLVAEATLELEGLEWSGALAVDGEEVKGKIVFERDTEGNPFKSEADLKAYLKEKFSVTYLRNKSKPAIETSG